ncbi:MAG TPA: 50S ribosomal protein L25 [Anaerolineaceae bacterium]
MEKNVLNASLRTVTGKQVKALRRQGLIPAVLYGHNLTPTPITLNAREATRLLSSLTKSSLVTINLGNEVHSALVREKQRNFIKGDLLHVDFQVVSLTEKIRTSVSLELVGTSPAVKDYNGVVVTNLTELEVECFPQDLPEHVRVDISKLVKIGDSILVRDVDLSDKVEVLADPDEVIVVVTLSGTEEITPAEGEAVSEPEVIEKGKKEEEVD